MTRRTASTKKRRRKSNTRSRSKRKSSSGGELPAVWRFFTLRHINQHEFSHLLDGSAGDDDDEYAEEEDDYGEYHGDGAEYHQAAAGDAEDHRRGDFDTGADMTFHDEDEKREEVRTTAHHHRDR